MPALNSQSEGVLAGAIRTIRRKVDEPDARAKYSDADILDMLNEAWQEVLPDLYGQAANPPLARYSVTLVSGQRYYNLPCTVGEIWSIAKRDSNNRIEWELRPQSRLSPLGQSISFEGTQRFLVDPEMGSGETIEFLYIPSGDCFMAAGVTSPLLCTHNSTTRQSTVGLIGTDATVSLGSVDRRPNAYLGAVLNVWGSDGGNPSGYSQFPVQTRIVKDYSVATGVLTVEPEFDVDLSAITPTNGVLKWEIYPMEASVVWPVLTRHVARQILADECKEKRYKIMTAQYAEAKRACILRWNSLQTRTPRTIGDTYENEDRLSFVE